MKYGLLLAMLLCTSVCAAQPQSPEDLQKLLDTLATADVPHADRWAAVEALRPYGTAATPGLLALLERNDGNVRYYAIRALGYTRDHRATEALCRILLDRDYAGRRYAAMVLGQIGDPSGVSTLGDALKDLPYVREDAIEALCKIGGKEAADILDRYYFSDPSTDLKLTLACDRSAYAVGDEICITATLTNVSDQPVLLAGTSDDPLGYLVFQRADGAFIESVNTGWRDSKVVALNQSHELAPRGARQCVFRGHAAMWKRGENDDHALVSTDAPFLTLEFRATAFHVRRDGNYQVRAILRQDNNLLEELRASGFPESQLQRLWLGNAVSNPCQFHIGP